MSQVIFIFEPRNEINMIDIIYYLIIVLYASNPIFIIAINQKYLDKQKSNC